MHGALDIETVPNLNLIDALPEIEVAIGNMVDPAKIAAKTKKCKDEQVSKMALDPFWGRICSYAVYGPDIKKYHTVDEVSDTSEIELISEILALMCVTEKTHPYIITWNGAKFDMPFIFKRAMLLKVEIPAGCMGLSHWTKKYTHTPHCDMMQEFTGWGNDHLKLDTCAGQLLGQRKIGVDCTTFLQMITDGKQDEIGIYNLMDSELTYNIHEAAAPYLW